MKKFIIPFLIAFFVFGTAFSSVSHAAPYDWAQQAVNYTESHGILEGNSSGDLMLGSSVTRAQFAAFVSRALNLTNEKTDHSFTDVPPSVAPWKYDAVYRAAAAGIVNGYDNGNGTFSFKPDQKITRSQMAVMIFRMLKFKGVVTKTAPLPFHDKGQINTDYIDAIENTVAWSIFKGDGAGDFNPEEDANRAQAVAVIYRGIQAIQKNQNEFHVASVSSKGDITEYSTLYSTFSGAKNVANGHSNDVVMKGTKIVWMHNGIAYTSGFTTFGDTYVPSGTELKYDGSDGNTATIELAGVKDTVSQSDVALTPTAMEQGRSYYSVSNGNLYHTVFNPITEAYEGSLVYGPAPKFMASGHRYYSWDGHTFADSSGNTVGTAYQYFDILPLNTSTSYTADQLNNYVKTHIPSSYKNSMGGVGPLASLGDAFITAQNKYGVNAEYLLAHAILESAWGSSAIAQNKHNLFGLGAADSDPYTGAKRFDSYAQCVDYMARYVSNSYLYPTDPSKSLGAFYNGDMLGNKGAGMNVKYASDPFWGEKIAGYMYQIDTALGGKDFGKYDSGPYHLAISKTDGLHVRTQPSTSSNTTISYAIPNKGAGMIVTGEVSNGEGTWYKIYSDKSDFHSWKQIYAYHNGTYSLLSNEVTVAGIK